MHAHEFLLTVKHYSVPYAVYVLLLYLSSNVEGKSISSLGEKNRVASSKWRCMEPEDKNRYQQIARQVSVDLTPDVAVTHYDKLHKARQVVAKIQENVSESYRIPTVAIYLKYAYYGF